MPRKGKIPPALKGYQFKAGSSKASSAGSKGGKISRPPKAKGGK